MSPAPTFSNPLFNFELIGPVGLTLVLLFLGAGLVFFFLSFTSRHGRSRWPLHALLALGILSVGSGFALAGIGAARLFGTLAISGGGAVRGAARGAGSGNAGRTVWRRMRSTSADRGPARRNLEK